VRCSGFFDFIHKGASISNISQGVTICSLPCAVHVAHAHYLFRRLILKTAHRGAQPQFSRASLALPHRNPIPTLTSSVPPYPIRQSSRESLALIAPWQARAYLLRPDHCPRHFSSILSLLHTLYPPLLGMSSTLLSIFSSTLLFKSLQELYPPWWLASKNMPCKLSTLLCY
jgi:hypothetical protein